MLGVAYFYIMFAIGLDLVRNHKALWFLEVLPHVQALRQEIPNLAKCKP